MRPEKTAVCRGRRRGGGGRLLRILRTGATKNTKAACSRHPTRHSAKTAEVISKYQRETRLPHIAGNPHSLYSTDAHRVCSPGASDECWLGYRFLARRSGMRLAWPRDESRALVTSENQGFDGVFGVVYVGRGLEVWDVLFAGARIEAASISRIRPCLAAFGPKWSVSGEQSATRGAFGPVSPEVGPKCRQSRTRSMSLDGVHWIGRRDDYGSRGVVVVLAKIAGKCIEYPFGKYLFS